MKRTLIAISAGLLAIGAQAQTSQKMTAGKASEYGLVYTLPKTAVDICIEAQIDEEHPGEFHNYARRHLGIENAITADSHGNDNSTRNSRPRQALPCPVQGRLHTVYDT